MVFMGKLIASFCALFLAFDVIGHMLPYLSVSSQMQPKQLRKLLLNSGYIAFFTAVVLMLACGVIFYLTGVSAADVQIAGGLLLFLLAAYAVFNKHEETVFDEGSAIFPVFAKMIIRPVFLIMLLVLMSLNGLIMTVITLILNLIVFVFCLTNSSKFIGLLESSGARMISRVVNMLLCAYAVMVIRQALAAFIK